MEAKVLEIRDRATFMSVFAIKMVSTDPVENYYLRRRGYGRRPQLVLLIDLGSNRVEYDWRAWPSSSRTMREAHSYIERHFDDLDSGDVVDVEYILGETVSPAVSERLE